MNDYDIIIAGGGISGTMAAVSAARKGVSVLLIEQYGYLGGMLTAAGVGPMMTFHAGKTQVIQGVTGELIDRLKSKSMSPGHTFDTTGYTYSVTPFDMEGMKIELESMVLEAGAEILYHTMVAAVHTDDNFISSLTICNKGGLQDISAKVFIDATGDADIAFGSGVPCTSGRPGDGMQQPLTMKLRIYGVDMEKVRAFIKEHPEEFPRLKGDTSIIDKAANLSIGGFVKILEKAKKAGDLNIEREDVLFFETNNPGEVIINTSRITGLDATDPIQLSQAETLGRKQAHELYVFLRKYIPGFEDSRLAFTGPSIGIRSSRQIVGCYTMTKEDILAGQKYSDAVVCNGYPIDIHSPDGAGTNSTFLNWGEFYTVPYRCLINDKIKNLIVVGRSISGEFEAQAAFRTTPGAGALGHAGGAAAALAVNGDGDCTIVDTESLRALLKEQGAYLV